MAISLLIAAALVEVVVCDRVPGAVINPHAPIEKQVRDVVMVCERVRVPDPDHHIRRIEPITDYAHDWRAIA